MGKPEKAKNCPLTRVLIEVYILEHKFYDPTSDF